MMQPCWDLKAHFLDWMDTSFTVHCSPVLGGQMVWNNRIKIDFWARRSCSRISNFDSFRQRLHQPPCGRHLASKSIQIISQIGHIFPPTKWRTMFVSRWKTCSCGSVRLSTPWEASMKLFAPPQPSQLINLIVLPGGKLLVGTCLPP